MFKWTTDKPIGNGWYWYRHTAIHRGPDYEGGVSTFVHNPTILHIRYNKMGKLQAMMGRYWTNVYTHVSRGDIVEWSDKPIPLPTGVSDYETA